MFCQLNSYNTINRIFIFLSVGVFLYSFLFPFLPLTISSSCNELPQIYCKSRGLSRAFSELMRLNYSSALEYNIYSLNIFSFFLYVFFSRIFINIYINLSRKRLFIISDVSLSSFLFLYLFLPLLA